MTHDNANPYPRILLFGAEGQLGTELHTYFQPLGKVIASVKPGHPHFTKCIFTDISDPREIKAAIAEVKPDLIVNAAAYTAVDKAESEIEDARDINARAPATMAEECCRLGLPLVHYSTDYVYHADGDQPIREITPPSPMNAYGSTKLEGDESIMESGCDYLIFRISWVYGAFGHNFVKTMIRLGKEREQLKIVDDQIGAPSGASFLASSTAAVLSRLNAHEDFTDAFREATGIYHLCPGGFTSWHGFANEIFATARARGLDLKVKEVLPISTKEFPTPAKRPYNSRLDTSKIKKTFNLHIPSWQEVWGLEAARILGS